MKGNGIQLVRVLIAEDNDDHMFLTKFALDGVAGSAVETIGVRDGAEALDFLYGQGDYEGRQLPNLVLLDLSMPKVDGLEVLEKVKADPSLHHIPIVVLTSSSRPEDIDGAYARGANSYVTKSAGMSGLAEYWTATATLPDA